GKDKSASWASQKEVLSSMLPQIPDFTTGDTLSALDPVGSAQNQTSPSNLGSQVPETTAPAKPFLERRAGFRTKLIRQGPSPQEWKAESPPEGVTEITYPSGELQLKAWIARPSGSSEEKHPALVYFHGGFAFGAEDFEVCRDFLKDGFVVMTPVLRGENGNPGQFELFFGEVEDGCAAVRWLAAQPYVKRDQIFAFGHSAGGGITTMMSLFEDLPLHHCGSAGGLYTAEILSEWSNLIPFDTSDPEEFRQRVLIGNVRDMKRNHFAYLGTDDTITASAVLNSAREVGADSMLTISQLTGDHFSSLKLAAERYLSVCRIDANMMELKNLTEQAQASAATARQFQIDMQQRTQREESGPGKRAAECEVRAEYETDPAIKATFYAIAANRRIECGEKEKAAEDLRLSLESGSDVVSKNPGEFYRLIGGVQMSLGQYSESLVNLEKSLQLTSDERERESSQVMITNLRTLSESAADGKP
ncbi:MAG: alpha/beta hydrolase family protein, partial [Planctomyces sp.]